MLDAGSPWGVRFDVLAAAVYLAIRPRLTRNRSACLTIDGRPRGLARSMRMGAKLACEPAKLRCRVAGGGAVAADGEVEPVEFGEGGDQRAAWAWLAFVNGGGSLKSSPVRIASPAIRRSPRRSETWPGVCPGVAITFRPAIVSPGSNQWSTTGGFVCRD